ncbi:phage tail protein [Pseudomonas asiatica]|uniref:phage tail protein n=1 Tax=Pseudomonas asiatica TaxID=2219225 RepID=UPI003878145C
MVDQTSQFYAILTNIGAAKQANADALGVPWTFSQMGVGDGNPGGLENPPLPMPTASQTALLNEWRRAPLNQLKIDPNNAAVIIAEQIIPADVGGKWIREISLYDADGDLVAVANCPPTFKPLLSQGSGRTQVVRVNLIVNSSSNVQLKIDPSVVLATREWVTEELAKQDFKHSVVAATTAAINLSGLQTVDGVVLTAGVRVLVKNQAAAKDNGLYVVVAGGAWTRCPDADTSAKVTPGMLVLVERGTVNAESAWQLVTDAPITLGVTSLAYEMAFGRTGVAAGTYRSVTVDAYGRVTAATNPTTVAGYGLTDVYTKTQVDQALALKANLASPTFTGTVSVPTPATGNNTTQAANTAFVQATIAALIASAPGALDTLNELAAAMGNDPNFAATLTSALALKAALASPAFTGNPTAPTPAQLDNDTSLATTEFVKKSGLTLSRFNAFTASAVLTSAVAGSAVEFYGSAQGQTLTLPLSSEVRNADAILLFNFAAVPFTIARQGADAIGSGGGGGVTSLVMQPGDSLMLIAGSNLWFVVGGTAANQFSGAFGSLQGNYGWQRIPGGAIKQWGYILTPSGVATANIDVVFPIQFPNNCFNVVASIGVWSSDYDSQAIYRTCRQELSVGSPLKSGVDMQAFMDNNLNSVRVVYWEAIGN